jgi:hypothetical protein
VYLLRDGYGESIGALLFLFPILGHVLGYRGRIPEVAGTGGEEETTVR